LATLLFCWLRYHRADFLTNKYEANPNRQTAKRHQSPGKEGKNHQAIREKIKKIKSSAQKKITRMGFLPVRGDKKVFPPVSRQGSSQPP
jgi:hypothetical protein